MNHSAIGGLVLDIRSLSRHEILRYLKDQGLHLGRTYDVRASAGRFDPAAAAAVVDGSIPRSVL